MRATTLALLPLLILAAPALAGPVEKAGAGHPMPGEGRSILSSRSNEESLARQVEFDRRIAERSNRAARSICAGCGAGIGAQGGPGVTPSVRNPRRDDTAPADPAEAPAD